MADSWACLRVSDGSGGRSAGFLCDVVQIAHKAEWEVVDGAGRQKVHISELEGKGKREGRGVRTRRQEREVKGGG